MNVFRIVYPSALCVKVNIVSIITPTRLGLLLACHFSHTPLRVPLQKLARSPAHKPPRTLVFRHFDFTSVLRSKNFHFEIPMLR